MATSVGVRLLMSKRNIIPVTSNIITSVRSAVFVYRIVPAPIYEDRKKKYRESLLKPYEETLTLEERLKELNKNPLEEFLVDISLPCSKISQQLTDAEKRRWKNKLKENRELEKLARENKLFINMEEIEKDGQKTDRALQLQKIADHFGIYDHLFQHAYFTPWVPLQVFYDHDEEYVNPVYHGNILSAGEVVHVPQVSFESGEDDLWTLVLTNLDGHLLDTNSEYLHWFIGNIKGNDLSTGDLLCDYMQPFPWRGTGYHRLVFVLYKQDRLIDFSSLKRPSPCHCLKERTFQTFDFYKAHQDVLTPAGLSFFQCTWDINLTNFIHDVLQMSEPAFEYNEPAMYYAPQVVVPHLQPFNLYLDRYRDPKDIKKEVLLKRLKTVHPFEEEPPVPKYPLLHKPEGRVFSWQKDDITNERLRLGKFRDLRPHSAYPQEDNQGRYKYPS